jgi:hypothetical protein
MYSARPLLLAIIILALTFDLAAQPYNQILNKLQAEYPIEKLYLHFDKEVYYPGETIWFKAYLFNGNFPSDLSKIVYVDLLDEKSTVMDHKTLPVVQSSSASSFILPFNLDGYVTVRCYTKWMLNFDSTLLYEKNFFVSQSSKKPDTRSENKKSYHLQFFPEGGSLVENVESRLAFKATDENGYPVSVSGVITNNINMDTITFQSVHDGMGTIKLVPKNSANYIAIWKVDSKEIKSVLPSVQKEGIVLEINNTGPEIIYTLRSSQKFNSPFITVVGQLNQQLIYLAKISIKEDEITSGRIPLSEISSGVVQITVFNAQEQALVERIAFANLHKCSFPVKSDILFESSKPRSKVSLEIEVPDSISSNLSVSITCNNKQTELSEENIFTKLLLDADLKGYVHNAAYYFSNRDSANEYLDLIMMTNGWRRYKWYDLLLGHFPNLKFAPEQSLTVYGEIKGLSKKELADKSLIGIVEFKSGEKYLLNSDIQPEGRFKFSNLLFYDSIKLYYQLNNDKKGFSTNRASFNTWQNILQGGISLPAKNMYSLKLADPERNTTVNNTLYRSNRYVFDSLKVKTLSEVIVTAKIKTEKEKLNEEYTSGPFVDLGNSRIIIPENDPASLSSQSLLDYLKSRYPGMDVNPFASEDPIIWRGWPTALFVNEISQGMVSPKDLHYVQDATLIQSLSMSEIAMVKIFDPPFVGAWGNGAGGCIAVYTKKAGQKSLSPQKPYSTLIGFTSSKEFYNPDYENNKSTSIPDFRNPVYWNPYIFTDKNNNKVKCTFYNNDSGSALKIVIEGCNANGKLIRVENIVNPR